MSRLLAALSVIAAVACSGSQSRCPEPIVMVIGADGGQTPLDPTTVIVTMADGGTITFEEPFDVAGGYASPDCAAACVSLRRARCSEATTRPGEDSCYVLCRRAEATRGQIDFKPRCIAAAQSREAIRACGTYRCQ